MDVLLPTGGTGQFDSYRPSRPDTTPLYQIVVEHLETFLAWAADETMAEVEPVPPYVEKTFYKFTECYLNDVSITPQQ